MESRVIQQHHALSVPEGDGVTVNRLMPVQGLLNFDPFVLWDHFDIAGNGFPSHPHRGFEGITYLFSGGMNHTDNLGNRGLIQAGGVQRFTAGSGIIHSEFPEGQSEGIQLWVNLPKSMKNTPPSYQQLSAHELPETHQGNCIVRTIIGEGSPLKLHTPILYQEIQLSGEYTLNIPSHWRGFIYVVEGDAIIKGEAYPTHSAAYIEHETSLALQSSNGARVMACIGQPHHEPIRQHGPFVD